MLLLLNLLLLPPLLLAAILAYFHLFGGPLAHHYLYVSGPEAAGTIDTSDSPSTASSATLFGPKNNRSHSMNSLLHRVRCTLLGEDETSSAMRRFRQWQDRLWRWYKYLLRRLVHTGELERMITESAITMVPIGNCMSERVGFHPHLVSLSVRINAYLRASAQLRHALELEANTSAEEMRAASLARASPLRGGGVGLRGVGAAAIETPEDGDEDETPMSTPSLAGLPGMNGEPPMLALGATGVHPSPLKTFAGVNVSQPTRPHHPTGISSLFSPASSSSSAAASSAPSSSLKAGSSSPNTHSADLPHLPQPPFLALAASDDTCSLALQDQRANHLLQLIVALKHVSRTSGATYSTLFRPVLYRALIYRNEVLDFIRFQLEPILTIKYDSNNVAHERWLSELWEVYLPLGPSRPTPESRVTQEWGQLGFQGDNPATDFRAMGVLGLRNLIEFARLAPIQSSLIMKHGQDYGIGWFGFAITGINLTADLVQLTRDHVLDAYFYTYGATWSTWHALYTTMFVKFDEAWSEARPPNVMSYGTIHRHFLERFVAEARAFPFSPRSLASDQFSIGEITPVTPKILHNNNDDDEDFEIEGVQRVTEGLVSRHASKNSGSSSQGGGGGATHTWGTLSRSTSPFSHSASFNSHPSSPNSHTNSPGLHALSRSEFLEAGGVLPLGNLLDPIVPPAQFAKHQLPNWRANT